MALSDILQKITADATARAVEIAAAAQAEVAQIRADGQAAADEAAAAVGTQTAEKIAQMQQKAANLSTAQRKTRLLATRQEQLDAVYTQALAELKKISNAEKEHIFARMLAQIDTKTGVITPASNDAALIAAQVKKAGKDFTVAEPVDGVGGFTFVSETVEIDFRFEEILRTEVKPQLVTQLATILFGK